MLAGLQQCEFSLIQKTIPTEFKYAILLLASLPVTQWETLFKPWLRTLNNDRLNLKGDDVLCWTQYGINIHTQTLLVGAEIGKALLQAMWHSR